MNAILFGYRFHGEKESEFADLKNRIRRQVETSGHPLIMIAILYPNIFKHLPLFKGRIFKRKKCFKFRKNQSSQIIRGFFV